MQITEQSVSYKRKLNVGNYETVEFSAGLNFKLDPGEDIEQTASFAFELCKENCKKQAIDFMKNRDEIKNRKLKQ